MRHPLLLHHPLKYVHFYLEMPPHFAQLHNSSELTSFFLLSCHLEATTFLRGDRTTEAEVKIDEH
jgi:hypothetical protein